MHYSLGHRLYSKTASSDLSTVLPLTETSGGKPPCLAHSAHVLLSRAEQLKTAPSFPVTPALPNKAWLEVYSPLQPGPHGRIHRKILKQSRTLNLLLICFWHYDPSLCLTAHPYCSLTATLAVIVSKVQTNHSVSLYCHGRRSSILQ